MLNIFKRASACKRQQLTNNNSLLFFSHFLFLVTRWGSSETTDDDSSSSSSSSSSSPFPHLSPRTISQRSLPSSSNTGNAYRKKLKCFSTYKQHYLAILHTSTHFSCFLFLKKKYFPFYMGDGVKRGPLSPLLTRKVVCYRCEEVLGKRGNLQTSRKRKKAKKVGETRQTKAFSFFGRDCRIDGGPMSKNVKVVFCRSNKKDFPENISRIEGLQKKWTLRESSSAFLLKSSAIFMCV